jgi:hypothetical protein
LSTGFCYRGTEAHLRLVAEQRLLSFAATLVFAAAAAAVAAAVVAALLLVLLPACQGERLYRRIICMIGR